jgi:hypothetical protein
MKKLITNYTFNATAQTITFVDQTSIDLESVLLITNVTSNVIVYNFANPAQGGSVAGNVLSLNYDTTLMSNSDALQVYYDDGVESASEITAEAIVDAVLTLKRIAKNMESLQVVDSNQRQRVNVEAVPTIATVTTLGNIAGIGGIDPRWQTIDWARAAADTLRTKLTFS